MDEHRQPEATQGLVAQLFDHLNARAADPDRVVVEYRGDAVIAATGRPYRQRFRFSLVGRNGQIVASSETYTTKAFVNGIRAVKTLAADAAIEDQTSKERVAQQEAEGEGGHEAGHQDGGQSSSAQ